MRGEVAVYFERALDSALGNMPTYNFIITPMAALLQGFLTKIFPEFAEIKRIFDKIGAPR